MAQRREAWRDERRDPDGGLVLGNGLVVDAVSGTTVVDGTATLAGAGTVEIPADVAAAGCDLPLVRATDFAGLDNLADWTVTHVPGNAVARVVVRDGVLRAIISRKGYTIFVR